MTERPDTNEILLEVLSVQREILAVQKLAREDQRRLYVLYRALTVPVFVLLMILLLFFIVMMIGVNW